MGDDDPGRHRHLRLRAETLGYNPLYGNGQCTDWAERQFHAWTGTYINTLGINGHGGNALDLAYNAAHRGWTVGSCSAWNPTDAHVRPISAITYQQHAETVVMCVPPMRTRSFIRSKDSLDRKLGDLMHPLTQRDWSLI
jgi:hypothetical protein